MDEEQFTPAYAYNYGEWLPKVAVGLVLLTMGVLVLFALLSFLGEPLDAKPASVIKAAADAAAAAAGGDAE